MTGSLREEDCPERPFVVTSVHPRTLLTSGTSIIWSAPEQELVSTAPTLPFGRAGAWNLEPMRRGSPGTLLGPEGSVDDSSGPPSLELPVRAARASEDSVEEPPVS